jgi:hypothetical protein
VRLTFVADAVVAVVAEELLLVELEVVNREVQDGDAREEDVVALVQELVVH